MTAAKAAHKAKLACYETSDEVTSVNCVYYPAPVPGVGDADPTAVTQGAFCGDFGETYLNLGETNLPTFEAMCTAHPCCRFTEGACVAATSTTTACSTAAVAPAEACVADNGPQIVATVGGVGHLAGLTVTSPDQAGAGTFEATYNIAAPCTGEHPYRDALEADDSGRLPDKCYHVTFATTTVGNEPEDIGPMRFRKAYHAECVPGHPLKASTGSAGDTISLGETCHWSEDNVCEAECQIGDTVC